MLNENMPIKELEICLREVKETMDTACKSNDILDSKIYNIIGFILSAMFGLLAIIFTRDYLHPKIIFSSFILVLGFIASVVFLFFAYKTRKYYAKGDLMYELEQSDAKYHNEKGMLFYLITQYRTKAEGNFKLNSFKGLMINYSVATLFISAIIAFLSLLF